MKIEIEKVENGWTFIILRDGVKVAEGFSVFYSRVEREIREFIETQPSSFRSRARRSSSS